VNDTQIVKVAERVAGKFRGKFPPGVSYAECVQDSALLVMQLKDQHADRAPDVPFEAWLVMRVYGDLMDRYAREWRRESRLKPVSSDVLFAPNVAYSADTAEVQETQTDVQAALDKLPEPYGQIMRLFMSGMTQTDIADEIGISQPRVSQMMKRAKVALRELLQVYE
jgi:RNA polymerase sigma factor (sigma-70 family)